MSNNLKIILIMKASKFLCIVLTSVFIIGTSAMNAQTKIYVHKSDGTAVEYNISELDSISFTAPADNRNFSDLVINEVDGNGKFVEIYNKGTELISLKGCILVKNESGVWWTAGENATIAGGEYYTVSQSGQSTGCATESTGSSGISSKQNLKFELKEPDKITVIDYFARTNGGNWGVAVTPAYDVSGTIYSFSRIPDGTGNFQLAVPSCNAANNESKGEIVTNP
jgi:hypothetical protein